MFDFYEYLVKKNLISDVFYGLASLSALRFMNEYITFWLGSNEPMAG